MQYAVHEALRCIVDETLEVRWARHSLNDKALCAGLNAMGLSIFGDIEHKMPVVTAINIPEGGRRKGNPWNTSQRVRNRNCNIIRTTGRQDFKSW